MPLVDIDTELLNVLPVAIYTTDAEGRITFFNEAAAEFWGVRPKLNSDQWCGSWRLFTPDGEPLPHDQCPMALTIKSGKPVRGEAIAERPDGTRRHFQAYPHPLKDKSGRMIGAINLLADVSNHYQNEAALQRLAAIVSSSDDVIVTMTLSGRITTWNKSATRIFGYEEAEMIGEPIYRLIPPERHDEERTILWKIARGEHIDHFETVRVAKDGRRIDLSLTISPLHDKNGKIVGASKVARDITEKKRSEELQRLLLGELNNPVKNTLAVVQSIATQTLRSTESPEEFAESFTGRLQALSKAHTLLTRNAWQGTDIAELVHDQLLDHDGEIRIGCEGPSVMLDPQVALSLSMILYELGTNARKYGALSVRNGRLSVAWELQGDEVRMFWRERDGPLVHTPLRRGFGATLIGKGLKAHGGDAAVHYNAEGVTCEIRLPVPQHTQIGLPLSTPAKRTHFAKQPVHSNLKGKRILVIEDEPLVSIEIEACLLEAGAAIVGPAGTVARARHLIESETFDGAFVDANLGGETTDEIATALAAKGIPFLFLTGYGRESLSDAFRDTVVIEKPYTREQLVAAAGQMFEARSEVA
jgi:PAS domain S-box-containing protein